MYVKIHKLFCFFNINYLIYYSATIIENKLFVFLFYNIKELYYDPVSKRGFIEYRLWTIRKNISPAKKKYTAKKRKINTGQPSFSAESSDENDDLLSQDLYQEKVRHDTSLDFNSFF